MDRETASPQRTAAPKGAEALFRLALERQHKGRLSEAEHLYRAALAADDSHLEAHRGLATLLAESGRFGEAASHFERYYANKPNTPIPAVALTRAYAALDKLEEAIAHYRAVWRREPSNRFVLQLLADLLAAARRPEEAVALLEGVIAHDPQDGYACLLLASLQHHLGRADKALAATRAALVLEPENPGFYVTLSAVKRFAPGDPDIVTMQTLLDRPMSDGEKTQLQCALAKAYRDCGAMERAFALQSEANRRLRTGISYDEARQFGFFAKLKAFFTTEMIAGKRAIGDSRPTPVFILGVPRSGTTLVEQILTSHPDALGTGESALFVGAARPVVPRYPEDIAGLDAVGCARIAEAFLSALQAQVGCAARIVNKNLDYVGLAGFLHIVFPAARFIHVVRDPLDVCLSCFNTPFASGMPYSYDLAEMGRYYRAYEDLMAHWSAVFATGTILKLRYEDLVGDPEGQTRRLLDHCGLSWDEACLAFHKSERLVLTASAAQVRRPIYKPVDDAWRPPASQLAPLLDALGEGVPFGGR